MRKKKITNTGKGRKTGSYGLVKKMNLTKRKSIRLKIIITTTHLIFNVEICKFL